MNMGIRDGIREGIPTEYFGQVLRAFIPDRQDGAVRELAEKQALKFQDEC